MYDNVIIISLDGMNSSDLDTIKDLAGMEYIMENGVHCKNVRSIYPSLTYPAHATIVTGKCPKNHGIVNNTKVQPDRSNPDWFWYRKDLKGETIYDIARNMGKTVASFLWPVTGGAKIKYNLPEIFPTRFYQNQVLRVLGAGSPLFCVELNNKFSYLRRGISQPYLDDFIHESSVYTIQKYNPFMTLIHYVDLDWHRHISGLNSIESKEALLRYGKRVTQWVEFLKEEGRLDKTLLIVLSDHGHRAVNKVIKPNVYLHKLNYVKLLEEEIVDFSVYFKSCDGSGYIYMDNPKDEELKDKIRKELTVLSAYEENGIESFVERDKAITLGADPDCVFMLEARDGYYFSESPLGEFIEDVSKEDAKEHRSLLSSHGYSPYKEDYGTIFLASGPQIRKNFEIPSMNLVDIGPTIAKLLGSSLWGTDGRIRYEIIEE